MRSHNFKLPCLNPILAGRGNPSKTIAKNHAPSKPKTATSASKVRHQGTDLGSLLLSRLKPSMTKLATTGDISKGK